MKPVISVLELHILVWIPAKYKYCVNMINIVHLATLAVNKPLYCKKAFS